MSLFDREKSFLAWIAVMLCLTAFSWERLSAVAHFIGWLLLWMIAMLLVVFVFCYIQRRREISRYQKLFREIFGGDSNGLPRLLWGSSHGYDNFTILFASREELAQPDRQNQVERFKTMIQKLCSHQGCPTSPFDVNQAVFVTYDCELDESSAPMSNERNA